LPDTTITGEVIEGRTASEWGTLIRSDLEQAVTGVITAGQHLTQAKAQLEHGEWLPFVDNELPISVSTADRFMAISANPVLADSAHGRNLPMSWRTLYELSRLEPAQLEQAIARRLVRPEMERTEATALVASFRTDNREPATRPVTNNSPPPLPPVALPVEDEYLDDFDGEAEDDGIPVPSPKTSGPGAAQKIAQVITNEWYTPEKYIEAARTVLGQIDLDPASSATANETVQATTYYHAENDGLEHPWNGRIWLNPPYGTIGPAFVTRLIEEYQAGSVKEAIVLVNSNCVPTKWFRPLWNYVLCFHYGRINFNEGTEERTGSTHGSVFVYLGPNPDAFDQEFTQFGVIVQRRS
jgi:hypothetical protein